MNATLCRSRSQMNSSAVHDCHGGNGPLSLTEVLSGTLTEGHCLRFLHDDILPPGSSIGVHRHEHDEEYYLILSGNGTMTLDGTAHRVGAGDIAAVYPGGSHGLNNDGTEPIRLLVICCA